MSNNNENSNQTPVVNLTEKPVVNVKMSDDIKKKYTSLGQMVKAGDYASLEAIIIEYKKEDKLKQFLEIQEGQVMNQMDQLLWYTPNYKGNEDNLKIAKLLIENGANPNSVDNLGRTPIMVAASDDDIDMLSLYISLGADINKADVGGNRCIYYAVTSESINAIEFLCKNGVNVNRQDVLSGQTMLHLACGEGFEKSIEKLIELGADPTLEDYLDDALPSECVPATDEFEPLFEKIEAYRTEWNENNKKNANKFGI